MVSLLSDPNVYLLSQSLIGAKRARHLFIKQYVNVKKGQRLLDFGCGPGYIVEYLNDIDYIGIDINKRYIDYARQKYGKQGRFICKGELDQSTIDDIYPCDIVIMCGLLHHLDDNIFIEILQGVKKVLSDDGKVFSLDGCYIDKQSYIARKILENDRGKHVRDETTYVSLVSKVFNSVESRIHDNLYYFPYTSIVMELNK